MKGSGNIFIILILVMVMGVSYLLTNGIFPNFEPEDKEYHYVANVYEGQTLSEKELQMNSLTFDKASITIIPVQKSQQSTLPTPTPSSIALLPTQTPIPISEEPTITTDPTVNPSPSDITPKPSSTPQPTLSPTPKPSGKAPLSSLNKRILAIARSQIGDKYGWGDCHNWSYSGYRPGDPPKKSDGCKTYDCSGFTGWVYYWATNGKFNMKGQTCRDYGNCYTIDGGFRYENPNLYRKYSYKELDKIQFGDLVYFGNNRDKKYPTTTHVALYVGEYGSCGGAKDCIIDASGSGGWQVSERSLSKVPKRVLGFLRPKL